MVCTAALKGVRLPVRFYASSSCRLAFENLHRAATKRGPHASHRPTGGPTKQPPPTAQCAVSIIRIAKHYVTCMTEPLKSQLHNIRLASQRFVSALAWSAAWLTRMP